MADARPLPMWNPRQRELSCAANAVSLLMPHVEPYFVRTVRAAVRDADARVVPVPDDVRAAARRFGAEESAHQVAHRRYHRAVHAASPATRRVERAVAATCRWLSRRRSLRWNLALVAASESAGFAIARWADRHLRLLQDGADPEVAALFLWHLAEEVDHKEAAFDVWLTLDGSRRRFALAMVAALGMLGTFTAAGTLVMLGRRVLSPLTWWRLVRWTCSGVFGVLPTVFVSCLPRHHPRQLVDPDGFRLWQAEQALAG